MLKIIIMSNRKKPLTVSETGQKELIQQLEEIIEELKNKESKEKGERKKEERKKCKHTSFTFCVWPQMKMQVFSFEAWCKS